MFREVLNIRKWVPRLTEILVLGTVLMAMLIPNSVLAMERIKVKSIEPSSTRSTDILPRITDSEVLGWQGSWHGIDSVANGSQYMEVRWRAIDGDKWMAGKMSFWPDKNKKTLLNEERIFIRPSETPGIYRGYIIGGNGVFETGTAKVENGIWHWTWTYSNGNTEKSEMEYYAEGKMFYKGALMDKNGRPVEQLVYNLSRPLPITDQNTETSPISHVTP